MYSFNSDTLGWRRNIALAEVIECILLTLNQDGSTNGVEMTLKTLQAVKQLKVGESVGWNIGRSGLFGKSEPTNSITIIRKA